MGHIHINRNSWKPSAGGWGHKNRVRTSASPLLTCNQPHATTGPRGACITQKERKYRHQMDAFILLLCVYVVVCVQMGAWYFLLSF